MFGTHYWGELDRKVEGFRGKARENQVGKREEITRKNKLGLGGKRRGVKEKKKRKSVQKTEGVREKARW